MTTVQPSRPTRVIVIGAGVGGLTCAALLAKHGYQVTVLEAQTYPGGCASTFPHKGFRFESGATVAGGFQPNGPHAVAAELLDLTWPVERHDPAWVVHLPKTDDSHLMAVSLTQDNADVLRHFPETRAFWDEQSRLADIAWKLSAQGLPWPPRSTAELMQLIRVGLLNFPADLQLLPFAFISVYDWLKRHNLHIHRAFKRFLDGQLLISAQTTSENVNAIYGATALDLARQGVYHVEGGIGGIAETLVEKLKALGGEILYRQRVTRIVVEDGRVIGLMAQRGRRDKQQTFYPADVIVANLTPWDLDALLDENSPEVLRSETRARRYGWGAFVLHLGVEDTAIPEGFPDHHQVLLDLEGALGETRSIFMSLSPQWDNSRAPAGQRAVTITTHTHVQQWWELLKRDEAAYYARKDEYQDKILNAVERVLPGFRDRLTLVLPGSPVTYQFYTDRYLGQVGGFPQTSLFRMRSPRTGIANLRLVGDSIFPGQSIAGVTLGGIRVARDIQSSFPVQTDQPLRRFATSEGDETDDDEVNFTPEKRVASVRRDVAAKAE
jgi:C-3',4' desaturase CrtD